jgi:hypothetical protein
MRPAIVPLVILVTSLSACGDSGGGSGAGSSGGDASQITAVTEQILKAMDDEDWAGVCDRLSPSAQKKFSTGLSATATCVDAWKLIGKGDNDIKKVDGDNVHVAAIKVKGNRATAEVTPTIGDTDPTFDYVRAGGGWKIDLSD